MENSITKIADLPSEGGNNQLQQPSRTQPLETISISNLKNKQESLAKIGKVIGITAERVRQIENVALEKLRENLNSNLKIAS